MDLDYGKQEFMLAMCMSLQSRACENSSLKVVSHDIMRTTTATSGVVYSRESRLHQSHTDSKILQATACIKSNY
jgi:hypothetical protein